MQRTIDTSELARTGGERTGAWPLAELPRLASLLADHDGTLAWRVRGRSARRVDGEAEDFLELAVSGALRVPCVRCLGPVALPLSIERAYRLVESEAEAERLDLDDARFDVLAGGRRFDLAGLVEDEAIMALPPMARHDHCALPAGAAAPAGAGEAETPRRPFAALAQLKNDAQNTDIIED